MSTLSEGLKSLNFYMLQHNSNWIVYTTRSGIEFTLRAVVGTSKTKSVDSQGFEVAGQSVDFLVDGLAGFEPVEGDMITYNGVVYVVVHTSTEGTVDRCWRWTDETRTLRRIHTKARS